MSTDADAVICFGIKFKTDFDFPWDDVDSDWDYETLMQDWWCKRHNFKPEVYPYTETGELKSGATTRDITIYRSSLKDFLDSNPIPYQLCHWRNTNTRSFILAAPQTIISCSHYAPQEFDIEKLAEIDYPKIAQELIQFCIAYGIEYDSSPSWYLSSYFA